MSRWQVISFWPDFTVAGCIGFLFKFRAERYARRMADGTYLGITTEVRRWRHVMQPSQVNDPDPMSRDVMAKCWNTGKLLVGRRQPDGTWTVTEVPSGR